MVALIAPRESIPPTHYHVSNVRCDSMIAADFIPAAISSVTGSWND
jgi:hypothetical protein